MCSWFALFIKLQINQVRLRCGIGLELGSALGLGIGLVLGIGVVIESVFGLALLSVTGGLGARANSGLTGGPGDTAVQKMGKIELALFDR